MASDAGMVRIRIRRSITAKTRVGGIMYRIDREQDALEQIASIGEDCKRGLITTNEYNYVIDCILLDVLYESGYEELASKCMIIKESHSPYWPKSGWVVPQ